MLELHSLNPLHVEHFLNKKFIGHGTTFFVINIVTIVFSYKTRLDTDLEFNIVD